MKFRLRTSTAYHILTLIILSGLEELAGIDAVLTPKQLNEEVLKVEQDIIKDETMKEVEGHITNIMGPLPKAGQADQKGIYNRLFQAYHFNVYGSRLYDRGQYLVKDFTEKLTLIRRHQLEWKNFNESVIKCKNAFEKLESTTVGTGKEDLTLSYVGNCSRIFRVKKPEWTRQSEQTLVLACHLMAIALHLACSQGFGDAYRFNGGRTDRLPGKASEIEVRLTGRLMKEYLQAGDDIEKHLKSLKEHIRQVDAASEYGKLITSEYNKIEAKLSTEYPFNKLYISDKNKRQAEFNKLKEMLNDLDPGSLYKPNCHSIHEQIHLWLFFTDDTQFAREWANNYTKLHMPNPAMAGVSEDDPYASYVPSPWKWIMVGDTDIDPPTPSILVILYGFYEKYWKVEPFQPGAGTDVQKSTAFVKWGIKWDWQIEGETELNFLHRARMGSDLLDSVVEELKCYLNLTYTEEKRKEMIENYNQLTDWKKAKLFMDESPTLFRPCVTENDTDLIGTCTRENHEICGPTYYDTKRQDPLNEVKGGLSLMKPKWMYRKVNGICKGIRTYITHYKICQCGFRMDCGDDLNTQITCQLVENDLVRKQCRGSIGYPCMTHPLAPGEHHRSCATGYCDKEENSCAQFHHYFFE